MSRYHLMCQNKELYYIIDLSEHGFCESGDGKVYIINTEDMISADTMCELLHKLQDQKSGKWFATSGYITEKGYTREKDYPNFNEKHNLDAWIKEVCDFRIESPILKEKGRFSIRFLSDLWIQHDSYTLKRIAGFAESMDMEVREYINEFLEKILEMTKGKENVDE